MKLSEYVKTYYKVGCLGDLIVHHCSKGVLPRDNKACLDELKEVINFYRSLEKPKTVLRKKENEPSILEQ